MEFNIAFQIDLLCELELPNNYQFTDNEIIEAKRVFISSLHNNLRNLLNDTNQGYFSIKNFDIEGEEY